jgi:hypothetical protein
VVSYSYQQFSSVLLLPLLLLLLPFIVRQIVIIISTRSIAATFGICSQHRYAVVL